MGDAIYLHQVAGVTAHGWSPARLARLHDALVKGQQDSVHDVHDGSSSGDVGNGDGGRGARGDDADGRACLVNVDAAGQGAAGAAAGGNSMEGERGGVEGGASWGRLEAGGVGWAARGAAGGGERQLLPPPLSLPLPLPLPHICQGIGDGEAVARIPVLGGVGLGGVCTTPPMSYAPPLCSSGPPPTHAAVA